MLDRLRIILSTSVTYLVALSTALVVIAGELGSVAGIPAAVVPWLIAAASAFGTAAAIIRKVTPVLPAARGILPPAAGTPSTSQEAELAAELAELRTASSTRTN